MMFVFIVFVEVDVVINFSDDCVVFWMMGFEQFCNVRQIIGDVFGFGVFMWNMCNNVISYDVLIVFD